MVYRRLLGRAFFSCGKMCGISDWINSAQVEQKGHAQCWIKLDEHVAQGPYIKQAGYLALNFGLVKNEFHFIHAQTC